MAPTAVVLKPLVVAERPRADRAHPEAERDVDPEVAVEAGQRLEFPREVDPRTLAPRGS